VKIYNEIVFDVDGNVVYEDSFEYSGDVMLCQEDDPYDINKDGRLDILDVVRAGNAGNQELAKNILKAIGRGMSGTDYMASLTDQSQEEIVPVDVAGEKSRADELLMQQSGALTANPMPSLPSISNVGAAPFSGSINWNAIPGGFQPLPQIAGGKKKLYQLSKFHGGMNQKSSPRDISDAECQEATNVTVSQVGRIKLLGDIKSTSSGITTTTLADAGIPSPGYGLYVFKSGYSLASTPVQGDYTINVSQDGGVCQLYDGSDTGTLTISNTATHVAPVFYAAGNGLYASNANLLHAGHANDTRKAAILVYRKDYNANITTKVWSTGEALLTSPTFIESAAGNSNNEANGKVTLEWDDGTVSFDPVAVDGAAAVHIGSSGSGNWGTSSGTGYFFYISWLFDNGCETGLTALQKTGGSYASGYTFQEEQLSFNFSVKNVDSTGVSGTNYLGGNARIHGARIYYREAGTVERYMLAEVSLLDGIMGAADSTFTPWDHNSDVYDLAANITFSSPPSLYTYVSKNGYYANEMYDKSSETITDDTAGPAAHEVRYRTAAVGSNGSVFIGCISFRGKVIMDGMMYSMPNKPGVFPELNVFDSPSSDGTPITALVAFKDKILQFKQDALYVINISNPTQFYVEASFRNCGIMNPCQAFQTPFGVIFANYIGCFIYDGSKVISLTSGKFSIANWGISEGSVVDTPAASKDAVKVPCVGYDPRSQSIIVLKDVGDNGTSSTTPNAESAWVYHMGTQSWTEGTSMISQSNAIRHSNFVISPNGYLSICQSDVETLKTYNIGEAATQSITYWTKDLDFGLPSQTKYLYKVYITYKGDASGLTVKWGADGHDRTQSEVADLYSFATNSHGGTESLTPLEDKDDGSDAIENWHVATLYPDNSAEAGGWYSMSIYMNGTVDDTFEINDISILYRARPIK